MKNLPLNREKRFDFVAWFIHYLSLFIPPVFTWAPKYQTRWFINDVIAGLSTGVYGIPQGMALGTLAGLTPTYGLYTMLAPAIIYILLGPSRALAIGPASIISLLVGSAVSNSANPALLATTLSFFMGLAFLLIGILRLGFLASIISRPIVVGFTAAASVIVISTQVKYFLGISVQSNNTIIQWFQWMPPAIRAGPVNGWAAVMSLSCLFFLISMKFHPRLRFVPGALVVSVFCILITWGFQLQKVAGLKIVGSIETGLPVPRSPLIPTNQMSSMISDFVVISAVSLVELVSISRTFAVKAGTIVSTNSELIAVGAASFVGSFFQAMPISASFSRTALNESAGTKSPLSAVVSVLLVIFVLCFANAAIYYLPMATLGAIVVAATLSLFEFEDVIYIYKTSKRDFFVLCVAFFMTLILGAEYGIAISVFFNIFFILFDQFRLKTGEVGQLPHYVTDTLFDVVHPDIIAEETTLQTSRMNGDGYGVDEEPLSPRTAQPNRSDALFVLRKQFPQAHTHPHLHIIRPADSLTYINIDSWVIHTVSRATKRLTPQWNVEASEEFAEVETVYMERRAAQTVAEEQKRSQKMQQAKDTKGAALQALQDVSRTVARRERKESRAPPVKPDSSAPNAGNKSLETSTEMSIVEASTAEHNADISRKKLKTRDGSQYSELAAPGESPRTAPSVTEDPTLPATRRRALSIIDANGDVREAGSAEVDPQTSTQVEEESMSKAVLEYAERTHRLEGFVIIDMIHMSSIDSIVVGRLKDLHETLAANYISLAVARPRPEVLRYLIPGGFVNLIGQDFVVGSVASCVIRCSAVLRAAKRFQALAILRKIHEPENVTPGDEDESSDYLARETREERDEKIRRARSDSLAGSYTTGEESIGGDEIV